MTYTHMTRFVAKTAGLLGSVAFVALASLPGLAESTTTDSRGRDIESGPSAVEEGYPGPSETPSGSPSVPGVSSADDPNLVDEPSMSTPSMPERDAMNSPSEEQSGPSAADEGYPGPSETPSGSPSVPGVSGADDPGIDRPGTTLERPMPERDALNPSQDSSEYDGPSAVDEGYPGPSESPSGSPSVPGVSGTDDPGINSPQ